MDSSTSGEAPVDLYRNGAVDVDGLLKVQKDTNNAPRCCQSLSRSTWLAIVAVAFLTVVGAVVLIRKRNQRWSRPAMWDLGSSSYSCDQVLSSTSLTSLCSSRRGAKNAVCTVANDNSYLFCNGQYWEKKSSSDSWVGICRERMCGAIWQDSHDCATLEFWNWQNVCLGAGATDDDLASSSLLVVDKYATTNNNVRFLSSVALQQEGKHHTAG